MQKEAAKKEQAAASSTNHWDGKSLLQSEHKLLTFLMSRLTEAEFQNIRNEQIGLAEMLHEPSIGFYSRAFFAERPTTEEAKTDDEEQVPVNHKQTLFSLMMSKDDNLLLQMGGLTQALLDSDFLTEEMKEHVPELFKRVERDREEAPDCMPMMKMLRTKTDLMDIFFDVLMANVPMRNFTARLFTRLLLSESAKDGVPYELTEG